MSITVSSHARVACSLRLQGQGIEVMTPTIRSLHSSDRGAILKALGLEEPGVN